MLKYYKVVPSAHNLKFATEGSACFDISASLIPDQTVVVYTPEEGRIDITINKFSAITIKPGDRVLVPTNLILDIPANYSVRIHPRSGLALKSGLILANCEGVIDSDYIDPLYVMIYNISGQNQVISDGDRIAQGELVKTEQYAVSETSVKPLQKSSRIGGFGSTGV